MKIREIRSVRLFGATPEGAGAPSCGCRKALTFAMPAFSEMQQEDAIMAHAHEFETSFHLHLAHRRPPRFSHPPGATRYPVVTCDQRFVVPATAARRTGCILATAKTKPVEAIGQAGLPNISLEEGRI